MIFSKVSILGKIVAALSVVATFLGALFLFGSSKKNEGRAESEAEHMEGVIDAIKDKAKLDRELNDDADARRELREKHYRD